MFKEEFTFGNGMVSFPPLFPTQKSEHMQQLVGARFRKEKKWGWHSRQQTGNLWNSLVKDTMGAESFHRFKRWMGQTQKLLLLHRNPTSGPRNPKVKVAGSCGTVMRTSMIKTALLFQYVMRQGWDIDPWSELCDHSYMKLNQFMSHQQLETPTTLENLFLLWRGLPVLSRGLSISQLICVLLTCKPEIYKGNMEAELQCHRQLAQEWLASLILCSSQTAVK